MSKEFKAKNIIFYRTGKVGAGESFYLYGRYFKKNKNKKKPSRMYN